MLDADFITKKIQLLAENVKKLEYYVSGSEINKLIKDDLKFPAIERYFQLAVDLMIDINIHILREGKLGAPDDLQSTFVALGECKVLENEFAKRIAPIVGARNMLVHRYEKLDKEMFLRNLKNHFSDFKTYMIQIDSYIKKTA